MPQSNTARQQKYYANHGDEIKEKNKEKIECDCGVFITRNNLSRHKKTNTHLLKAKIIKYEFIKEESDTEAEK